MNHNNTYITKTNLSVRYVNLNFILEYVTKKDLFNIILKIQTDVNQDGKTLNQIKDLDKDTNR